jgi:hypothetical protein
MTILENSEKVLTRIETRLVVGYLLTRNHGVEMAELILTDEEKAAASYLEWDDASLGRMVKALALRVRSNHDKLGKEVTISGSAALLLIHSAEEMHSETMELRLNVTTYGDRPIGDWRVLVTKVPAKLSWKDRFLRWANPDEEKLVVKTSLGDDGKHHLTGIKMTRGSDDITEETFGVKGFDEQR